MALEENAAGRLVPLGRTSARVARLAFGCEQLGGYQWGAVDPHEIALAVELALARGITLFDTADCYGRGESERRLGRILRGKRAQALIATKFGVRFAGSGSVYYDSTPQWAEQAAEQSLARLGVETIDLFQMHYWDGATPLEALFDRLERLRESGKIRWYGITNARPDPQLLGQYPGLASFSLEFSLLQRSDESLVRVLQDCGLTFLAHGSLAQGLLSGKYQSGARFSSDDRRARAAYRHFHGEQYRRNCRIVDEVARSAATLGATPVQVALAWILRRIPGSVAIVGIKSRAQLNDAVAALSLTLDEEVAATLDRISAVPTSNASTAP